MLHAMIRFLTVHISVLSQYSHFPRLVQAFWFTFPLTTFFFFFRGICLPPRLYLDQFIQRTDSCCPNATRGEESVQSPPVTSLYDSQSQTHIYSQHHLRCWLHSEWTGTSPLSILPEKGNWRNLLCCFPNLLKNINHITWCSSTIRHFVKWVHLYSLLIARLFLPGLCRFVAVCVCHTLEWFGKCVKYTLSSNGVCPCKSLSGQQQSSPQLG